MATATRATSLQPILASGGISLLLYGGIFANAETLTSLSAQGGVYCLLPVLTVFVVSYFYAAFAGRFWEAVGVRPARPVPARRPHRSARTLRRRECPES